MSPERVIVRRLRRSPTWARAEAVGRTLQFVRLDVQKAGSKDLHFHVAN
ncbi:MAG: hypothetical protein LAP13_06660 [Acidobacteriia bacterium]|nr:hypothetical protein [Terriglobia bacterium]